MLWRRRFFAVLPGWSLPRSLPAGQGSAAGPIRDAPGSDELPGGHLPALDALRGLAILLVLAYRLGGGEDGPARAIEPSGLIDLGARGVDLFFVLSGFLITRILHDTRSQPHYFRNFYARRVLRIFPLYFATLALLLTAWLPLPAPLVEALRPAREHAVWLWAYGVNLVQARENAWCLGAMNHFWSLSIEEHFYLLWPAVIYVLPPAAARKLCLGLVLVAAAGRVLWIAAGGGAVAAFVLTPLRMDGLALGGWLALTARQPGGLARLQRWAVPSLVVCGGIASASEMLGRRWGYLPLTAWAGAFAALLVLALSARPGSWLHRGGRWRWLHWLGRYSYGIYVFQLPLVYALADVLTAPGLATATGNPLAGQLLYALLLTAANLALASVSWHLLEGPILSLKKHFGGSDQGRPTEICPGELAAEVRPPSALAYTVAEPAARPALNAPAAGSGFARRE